MSSLVVRCLTRAVWVKGRVRKQGSKPFVNPDKRTGRLSGSAEKPTSKRIKLAATIVGTSESALVPNSPAPEGRVTFFQKRQQPRRRRRAFGAFYSTPSSRSAPTIRCWFQARNRTFRAFLREKDEFWHDSGLSRPFHQQLRPQTAFRGTNRNFPNLARCFQTRKVRFRAILSEMAVTTFRKSGIVPSRSSLRRKARRACPPLSGSQHSRRTAGACAIRRLRAV